MSWLIADDDQADPYDLPAGRSMKFSLELSLNALNGYFLHFFLDTSSMMRLFVGIA
jgi:hypothetical protein